MKPLSIIKKILLCICLIFAWLSFVYADTHDTNSTQNDISSFIDLPGGEYGDDISDLCEREDCGLRSGAELAGQSVRSIDRTRDVKRFIIDTVRGLLSFLALVAFLLILYAGFLILTAGGEDDRVTKGKKILIQSIAGIIIITLANIITITIFRDIIPECETVSCKIEDWVDDNINKAADWLDKNIFIIPLANAASFNEQVTFKSISEDIVLRAQELQRQGETQDPKYQSTLSDIKRLVESSALHFPDDTDVLQNQGLLTSVLANIEKLQQNPESATLEREMLSSVQRYISQAKVPTIQARITMNPTSGHAPFFATLRASNVFDASGIRIPEGNYIWYKKKTGGNREVIGRGVSIGYTFPEEGSHIIFLEIQSASRNSKGKVDVNPFQDSILVQVDERLANINFYINNSNLTHLDEIKISANELRDGELVFNARVSGLPDGVGVERTLWDFGNGNQEAYVGSPRVERQKYVDGNYTVTLEMETNRGDVLRKSVRFIISHPVAVISPSSESGFAGDNFRFTAKTAFQREGVNYFWKIQDAETGETLKSDNGISTDYVFNQSGLYIVELRSVTADREEDVDVVNVSVTSRPPVARFTHKIKSSEKPNTIVFDATRSFDPDITDGGRLRFRWFVDTQEVELQNTSRNGAIGEYTFDKIGTHNVSLQVIDEEGKLSDADVSINIRSLLAVDLSINPVVVRRQQPVTFQATAPWADVYEWNFGAGGTNYGTEDTVTHTYNESGVYNVSLVVRNTDDQTKNSIRRSVYVLDASSPYAVISAKKGIETLVPTTVCDGKFGIEADRVNTVVFSGGESVNVDGSNFGLSYEWSILNDDTIFRQKDVSFRFNEEGCFPVRLKVTNQKTGKTHTTSMYVEVKNQPAFVSNMHVFVQDLTTDPVIVNVKAENAKDPDGAIVSYLWYYYSDIDSEPQGFRITATPEVTYVLPQINGRYHFVAVLEDNEGRKISTEEMYVNRKFSTPELRTDSSLTTPIVDFSVSEKTVKTGVPVEFSATVKNVIGRDISEAEYKWDVDGDGFYDYKTTTGKLEHTYPLPGKYNSKLKVVHRGVATTKYQRIDVQNDLRPSFDYVVVDDKLIGFNTTTGSYRDIEWRHGDDLLSTNRESVVADSSRNNRISTLTLVTEDGVDTKTKEQSVKSSRKNTNTLRAYSDEVILVTNALLTTDETTGASLFDIASREIEIDDISEQTYLYLGASRGDISEYRIDTNLDVDSNLNGVKIDDIDNSNTSSFTTGAPYKLALQDFTEHESKLGITLVYEDGRVSEQEVYTLIFNYIEEIDDDESFTGVFTEVDTQRLKELQELINLVDEKQQPVLNGYLSRLEEGWFDVTEKTQAIIDFQAYIDTTSEIDSDTKEKFFVLLDTILVQNDEHVNAVGIAVSLIQNLIPIAPETMHILEDNIETGDPSLVNQILSHPNNTELNKEIGKEILEIVKDRDDITNENKLLLKEQVRIIAFQWAEDELTVEIEPQGESFGLLRSILKFFVFLIIVLVLGGLGFWVFTFAKNKLASGDEDDFDFNTSDELLSEEEAVVDTEEGVTDSEVEEPAEVEKEIEPKEEKEEIKETIEEDTTPDWLTNETDDKIATDSQQEKELSTVPDSSDSSDALPDWLTGTKEDKESVDEEVKEEDNNSATEALSEAPTESKKTEEDALPDWLGENETKTSDTATITDTKEEVQEKTEEDAQLPDWLQWAKDESVTSDIDTPKEDVVPEVPSENQDGQLPDWLSGQSNDSQESKVDTSSESSEKTLPAWLQDEDAIENTPQSEEKSIDQEVKKEEKSVESNQEEKSKKKKTTTKKTTKKSSTKKKTQEKNKADSIDIDLNLGA